MSPSWGKEGTLLSHFLRDALQDHKLHSMCVAVLHNHTETSDSLEFSICIFPQTQCAPRPCDCLLAPLQDQDPFSDKFLKNTKFAFQHPTTTSLSLWGTASHSGCQLLHDYSEYHYSSFRDNCLASSNHQFLSGSVFFSDEKEIFWSVHPALLLRQFNEYINKAPTRGGEGGAQSLGSIICILHSTTSFCAWAINTAINTTVSCKTSWRLGSGNSALHLK